MTGNVVEFEFGAAQLGTGFDRILSVEMFEHMKNYGRLLARVSAWMRPDALLFVHIFVHRLLAYHFEVEGRADWMSRYFFTGGTMPSENLLLHFQDDVRLEQNWWVSGTHYERTSNHWLDGMDAQRDRILPVFAGCYGDDQAATWFQRWRMFYMAVAEFFGYEHGSEWGVTHLLFEAR